MQLFGLGSAIASGNVNGDRYADIVVGAGTSSPAGGAVVLYGGPHGLSASRHRTIDERSLGVHPHRGDAFGASVLIGPATRGIPGSAHGQDYFGQAVHLVNAGGQCRLLVGAPGENDGARQGGMVVSLRGTSGGLTARGARALGDATGHEGLGGAVI